VSISRLSNWENGHVRLHPEELSTIAELLKAELDAMPVLRHTSSIYHYLSNKEPTKWRATQNEERVGIAHTIPAVTVVAVRRHLTRRISI
jgi:hypothetical protein